MSTQSLRSEILSLAPKVVKMELTGISRIHKIPGQTVTALQDINLKIYQGEILCLLGPSGCGNSTLLNLMAGLDFPTAGEIKLGPNVITGAGPDRVVIFQEAGL